MTHMARAVHNLENKFDKASVRLCQKHPYIFFLSVFIGAPLFVLAAVCVCTLTIIIPISLIMGWV